MKSNNLVQSQCSISKFLIVLLLSSLSCTSLRKQGFKVSPELLSKIPYAAYNIKIKGGVENKFKFLSTIPNGTKVDLYSKDDNSGRQKWMIEALPWRSGINQDGVECVSSVISITSGYDVDKNSKDPLKIGRKYLSTDGNRLVDLWYSTILGDYNQIWYLCPHQDYWNIIMVRENGSRAYLSTNSVGLVDLWNKDDASGRQRWSLEILV